MPFAVKGLVALWGTRFVQGHTADGYQLAKRALALVEPESELSALAHFGVGGSSVSLGMPAEAIRHLDPTAKWARGALSLSIGTRPDVHGMAWSAHAHWLLGHSKEALSSCRKAIELARAIDHPYSLAVALAYGSITHQMRHDTRELNEAVAELRWLCDRYGFAYYREWALVLAGLVPGRRLGYRPGQARHQQPQVASLARAHAVLAVTDRRRVRAHGPPRPGEVRSRCGHYHRARARRRVVAAGSHADACRL